MTGAAPSLAPALPADALPAEEVVASLDLAGIGYVICDASGRVRAASPGFRRTINVAPDAPLPREPWFRADAAPEWIKAEREAGWEALMALRRPWKGWVRWHAEDGSVRILEGTARTLKDDRVLMTSIDRTEQFDASRALADTEAAQRAILDELPLSVALQAPDGRVIYVNNYLPRRLGFDRRRIIGLRPNDDGALKVAPEVERMLTEARARAEPLTGRLVPVTEGPLAGTRWAFYGVPIKDRDGALLQYLSVAADRTADHALAREREEFAQAIARTQRVAAINDFAGTLAHELSNILHPVGAYARRLARDPDREDRAELASQIDAAVMNAGRILRRTLTMNRAEDAPPRPVPLVPLVEQVIDSVRDLAPKGLTYELSARTAPDGLVQPTEFRQVLLNLLNNAADAQHYKGTIRVLVRTAGHVPPDGGHAALGGGPWAQVSVSDEGPGIDPDAASRLFEPFFTTKKEGRGTGLGLPVALGLVTGWGGTISVRSRPGRGARFTIWIPQRQTKGETSCLPS